MNAEILVIEDEPSIADNIIYALQTEGFSATWVKLGLEGIKYIKAMSPQLLILDIGLPDVSGFEVCKQIRKFSDIPIIFLTARDDEVDRVVGLEIGGDDYVTKPFSPRELVARVKVILKRLQNSRTSHPIKTPGVTEANQAFIVDTEKAQIRCFGIIMELTRYEYLILENLLKYPERVFSREQLMQTVWSSPESSLDRAVDTHIKSIRAKIRQVRSGFDPIKTHRGLGYSISKNVDEN